MSTVELSFTVTCNRPPWSIHHWDRRFSTSMYRLYVDNELMTERTWLWDNNTALAESIIVNINDFDGHNLILTPIVYVPEQAKFKISDFKLVGHTGTFNRVSDLEMYFVLR